MRSIYIAGKFEAQARLRAARQRIHEARAGKVVGTWLDEEPESETTAAQRLEFATRDLKEIGCDADLLILDTFDDDPRGGREAEFGFALGLQFTDKILALPGHVVMDVWLVGPKRNVFHELVPHFRTWSEVVEALLKAQDEEGNR